MSIEQGLAIIFTGLVTIALVSAFGWRITAFICGWTAITVYLITFLPSLPR